jgi:CubicO group peptidase (beta-lactamase class C family)
MEFDSTGNFVGSAFLHMTARDYARLGYLYLRGGEWNGAALLSQDWVKFTSSVSGVPNGAAYGAHFWRVGRVTDSLPPLALGPSSKAFEMLGAGGQVVLIVPERSLVIVRLGNSPDSAWPEINEGLKEIVASFAAPHAATNFIDLPAPGAN